MSSKSHSRESSEFEFVNNKDNIASNMAPPSELPSFLTQGKLTNAPKLDLESKKLRVDTNIKTEGINEGEKKPKDEGEASSRKMSVDESLNSPSTGQGIFGWVKGASGGIFGKVAEKTRCSVETVITTLDPQMKDFIRSGGDIDILVTSEKESKIVGVRDAFQEVFGKATVQGVDSQPISIAEQPIGFASGRAGCEERIFALRQNPKVSPNQTIVAVESFLVETSENMWMDFACVMLLDPLHSISLHTYSQATPVETRFVSLAKLNTPKDYSRLWSGLQATIGSVISSELNIDSRQWHEVIGGVPRQTLIYNSAFTLAAMYKKALLSKVEDI